MEIIVIVTTAFIIAAILYILLSGLFYLVQEICADVKKAKRRIKQGVWDLEWEWKLWKEGVKEWLTK